MGKWMKAIACGLLLCLCISLCGFSAECGEIRERVLRLHILANSDSGEDQQLKLKVRDAVVREAAGLFDGTQDAGEALGRAEDELPRLIAAAQQVVWDEGYDYTVQAKLCHMYFTTRQYETVSLPAGMYDAVRFTIGKGEGKNWWCVMFPPMCNGAARRRILSRSRENTRCASRRWRCSRTSRISCASGLRVRTTPRISPLNRRQRRLRSRRIDGERDGTKSSYFLQIRP